MIALLEHNVDPLQKIHHCCVYFARLSVKGATETTRSQSRLLREVVAVQLAAM
jgi:hypothetical protein